MSDATVRDVRNRSVTVLQEIRQALDAVDAEVLLRPVAGWPLWKQFYHVLYWLDHWFIDPLKFSAPAFHEVCFLQPDVASPKTLTKEHLLEYFGAIQTRIEQYLSDITPQELERQTEVRGQMRSRLDMILGQFTHVSHHIGCICATVRTETGKSMWPTEG